MLVLLPPSETKALGGGAPLDLAALGFPELAGQRSELIGALSTLATDLPAARAALKVTASKDDEITANRHLTTTPAMPAINRYTGVLYDALDIDSLTAAQRVTADSRILISSALFGAVRATDRIPTYRLSAGSRLPGFGTLAAFWKRPLTAALTDLAEPILDLRSGAYAALAPLPEAISARVVTEHPDGSRTVVSHFNKATKGLLARAVGTAPTEPQSRDDVIDIARAFGLAAEPDGPHGIEIVTSPASPS